VSDQPGERDPVAQSAEQVSRHALAQHTLTMSGPEEVAWARRAEERDFSALATIDRIVY
jgi:hypothetical protein